MSRFVFFSVLPFECLLSLAALSLPARADDVLHAGVPTLDRPTLVALGVRLPISGDDNYNAAVRVQYRRVSEGAWTEALPLYRVRPEVYAAILPRVPSIAAQLTLQNEFAGSIVDLMPGTTYVIRLRITDPDGNVNEIRQLTATTRPVPRDPPTPTVRLVTNAAELGPALRYAQPGDIILLGPGEYHGRWQLTANGAAGNPIVIRGANEANTILDGDNCTSCNVLEIYSGHVHIENLTIRNASRAIRFYNRTTANVVRRVHITNTKLGIGSATTQTDFYIADNILEGRLVPQHLYSDKFHIPEPPTGPQPESAGTHANDDGIRLAGSGHVIARNRISGYGDAMKIEQVGARAVDFYGNDILWTYDNGVELDDSEGNVRCWDNRFTNTSDAISAQPVFGGPAYIMHNVVWNGWNEQLKFKARGVRAIDGLTVYLEPAGMLVYNNTFRSPLMALNLQTPRSSHYIVVENNLFVGADPVVQPNGYAAEWTGPIHGGLFDHNGYTPDGVHGYGFLESPTYRKFANFAAVQVGAGREAHGLLLSGLCANGSPFVSCLAVPAGAYNPVTRVAINSTYTFQPPPDPAQLVLRDDSNARGAAVPLPTINVGRGYPDGYVPDLGAIQSGAEELPEYGPRQLEDN